MGCETQTLPQIRRARPRGEGAQVSAGRWGQALLLLVVLGAAVGLALPACTATRPEAVGSRPPPTAGVAPVSFPRTYDLSRPGARDFRIPQSGCFTCHPSDGKGIPGKIPPLAGSEWVNGREGRLIRILLCGMKGPVSVSAVYYAGDRPMPAFGRSGPGWSDQRIADVLTFIRAAWSNEAAPVTPEAVARVRAEVGDHREWTAEELLRIP